MASKEEVYYCNSILPFIENSINNRDEEVGMLFALLYGQNAITI